MSARTDAYVAEKEAMRRRGQLDAAAGDRACRVAGCGLAVDAHDAPCVICRDSLSHHDTAREDECWEGLARMAAARRPEDRTALDEDALRLFPHPRSGVLAVA